MAGLEFFQFPVLSDNYCVLIHSPETGETAAVDAADATTILAAAKEKGWKLTHLLITHHHWDHTDGLAEIKQQTGCTVIGPKYPGKGKDGPVEGVDTTVGDGDTFTFAGSTVEVLHTPGHTLDMVNYHFPEEKAVFTGDTLFVLGCGRVFEGDGKMMWESLEKLAALPPETSIYCGHEYTLSNARFAITVDPSNEALKLKLAEIGAKRERGEPTVPGRIGEELKTNPFLRPADPAIRKHLGMETAKNWEVFTEIRKRKDNA